MNSLQSGELNPILKEVKGNDKITLEIRENYIVLYYRGRSLLQIHSTESEYNVKISYEDKLKGFSIPAGLSRSV